MTIAADKVENKIQDECINSIEGQYLVLAGPGTGKTYTISKRIKNMIEQGIDPNKILCLTFSEAGAREMKTRIDKELNTTDSGISIYTFHSFCVEIIRNYPDTFGFDDSIKPIPDAVKKELLKECIDIKKTPNYANSKKRLYGCIGEVESAISSIKQYRLTKEKFFSNIKNNPEWLPGLKALREEKIELLKKYERKAQGEKVGRLAQPETYDARIEEQLTKIKKMSELWSIYEKYSKLMTDLNYIDFNDMINLVLDKFENNSAFLEEIAHQYEYLLVDEYQDTNPAQNEIIFNLVDSMEKNNVFVVGDDDQIIFAFQGARLDTMDKFLQKYPYPKTKVYCLPFNYRSTQSILDVSRKQILAQLTLNKGKKDECLEIDDTRLETNPKFAAYNINKGLIANNEDVIKLDKKVEYTIYDDEEKEREDIVSQIEQLVNEGVTYSDIAVLTVGNAELKNYAQLLKDKNIPVQLKDGKNIFEIPSVLILYYYMSALVDSETYSDRLYKTMFLPPFQIDPVDYSFITLNKGDNNFISYLKSIVQTHNFKNKEKIEKFINCYDYLKDYSLRENIRNTVVEIGAKTGIFDFYINGDKNNKYTINKLENVQGIKKLVDTALEFSSIKNGVLLKDFVDYLDIFSDDEDLEIRTDKPEEKFNAVQLSTYHSSKGKEFGIVFMPQLMKSKWEDNHKTHSVKPNIPLDLNEAKDEDEYRKLRHANARKLMYVGLTRAIHTLKLSNYNTSSSRNGLSGFLNNELLDLCAKFDKRTLDSEKEQEISYNVKPDYNYVRDFDELIKHKIEKMEKFSPSLINDYLKCPRLFLYDRILGLSSKAGNPDMLSFGSSIHIAFEKAVNFARDNNGIFPDVNYAIEAFEKDFKTRPILDNKERKFYIIKGKNTIENYYGHLSEIPLKSKDSMQTEKVIRRTYDGIKFKGIIDRLDINEDGTYSIYDYKTGSDKSKDIAPEGNYENYYNQIAFYKYMLEHDSEIEEENKDTKTGKVNETVFIFPELDEKKQKFSLPLTDIDCKTVKDKFFNAIKEIKSLNFDCSEKRSDDYCKYCSHRQYCGIDIVENN